jgi:uncharacterized repeat protein (TIGR03803 family)
MKRCIKNLFLLPALITGFELILVDRVTAQTFTTLHSFSGDSDGGGPYGGLILSGNALYGTASGGGSGAGTVFKLNTDGTGFTTLYNFTALIAYTNSNGGIYNTNTDGAYPGFVVLSGTTLYGTAGGGGSSGNGTVFVVNTDGTGFTNLYSFTALSGFLSYTNSDGARPFAGLILSGNTLYGATLYGGSSGNGTVFTVTTDGSSFTNLHSFTAGGYDSLGFHTNSDGANPFAGLLLSGSTLYGTAEVGGSSGNGTVFKVNSDGTSFTTLHSFAGTSDGVYPLAGLILSGNTLYGTARYGGSSGNGTVFAISTDGTGFTNLYSFTSFRINSSGVYTNRDGANPQAGLILSGNTLYGTAAYGGSSGAGTVFAVSTDGTGFTNLHSFTATSGPYPSTNSDGATPGGLLLSGNTLYGTTIIGGSSGFGTAFSLSLVAPQLTTIRSGANIILTWPTNAAGFTLQSAPAITSTFTNIAGATSPYTNAITSAQQFFRLISN